MVEMSLQRTRANSQAGPLVEHRIVNLNGQYDATIVGESHNTKTPRGGFRGKKLSIHQGLQTSICHVHWLLLLLLFKNV